MRIYTLLSLLLLVLQLPAQQFDHTYYLPTGNYNSEIKLPKEIINHEVGEFHITHDKLVYYFKYLAEASNRAQLEVIGYSHEKRPQLNLIVSSPENLSNLEQIRKDHMKLLDPKISGDLDVASMPSIVYQAFSIHGNESSGSNASMLTAYYLLASNEPHVKELLENVVIIIDPSQNPDGLQRFSTWVNSRKNDLINADPQDIEHDEGWPSGRTNHYWFDLNRDWLPGVHPESRGRIAQFQKWYPNFVTDHHEMGTNSTFFFQPGVPSRTNPLTPARNYELTMEMGTYHAKALDSIHSLYFTQENYDDFYYGKGSTYPDINGSVGILFEQASSRAHAQESDHGIVTFPFTIKNQFVTSLSTLEAAKNMRVDLLNHMRNFYREAAEEASKSDVGAYVIGSNDQNALDEFAKLVSRHNIQIFHSSKDQTIDGFQFSSDQAMIIPAEQTQYRLIQALFRTQTSFQDSIFYDISSWTMPMAFDLNYKQVSKRNFNSDALGSPYDPNKINLGNVTQASNAYAYIYTWDNAKAASLTYDLLNEGIRLKVATQSFEIGGTTYKPGTILLATGVQDMDANALHTIIKNTAKNHPVDITALSTGLDYGGTSLGSRSFETLELPKIALLTGGRVSTYEAGEVWHILDIRFRIPVSKLDVTEFRGYDLSRYNRLLMVDGSYGNFSERDIEKLKNWVSQGGVIIANKRALNFLNANGLGNFIMKKSSEKDEPESLAYSEISNYYGSQRLSGAIFKAEADLSHPLFYGKIDPVIPLFKNSTLMLEPSKNPFGNPISYTNSPLLSGYVTDEQLERIKGTPAFGLARLGSGKVLGFTENLNFRGFWFGTNRMYINAIFFGHILSSRSTR